MACSTSQCFRAKFLAHADPDRFADTRLRTDAQPNSYRDSNGYGYRNSDVNAYCHCYRNGYCNSDSYRHVYADSYSYGYGDPDSYTNVNANTDLNTSLCCAGSATDQCRWVERVQR